MKKAFVALIALVLFGLAIPSYASDWDKAGKILAGIEGVRVLTGGRVDIIGTAAGIPSRGRYDNEYGYSDGDGYGTSVTTKVWVPQTVWEEKWVPAHREFRPGRGWVFVQGHYVRYQVAGGYWADQGPARAYQHVTYNVHYR